MVLGLLRATAEGMMSNPARPFLLLAFLMPSVSAVPARGQTTWQPTPPPAVTAENEAWFQSGEPIMFLDSYYYRAGAQVFLNRYQMVQTGSYRGIPVYADTTQDPYNVIYV